jgi:tripartite-type tricarboxylate transporter receptor subunit TctC
LRYQPFQKGDDNILCKKGEKLEMRSVKRHLLFLCVGLLISHGASVSLKADAVSDFYDGRQVRLLIGYSAGGGYDTYARLLARHLGKHIPGNPTIVPQNMPGAGSLILANFLYNVAPKDGSVIATFGRGIAMEPLLSGMGTRFDARKFSWIGSLNNEVSVCASWHESDVKSMRDLETKKFIVGATGSGADTVTFPVVISNLVTPNIKLIPGYPGGNDVLLAMERGEVDGRCAWSTEGRINILVQLALEKHPDLPNIPLITDFADNEDELMAMELIFSRQVMGRPYLAPPRIPIDRHTALKNAFDATTRDPDFLADALRIQLEINPVNGQEIDDLIARIYDASDDVVRLASEAVVKNESMSLNGN